MTPSCVPDAVQRFFSGAPQSRDRTKRRRSLRPRLCSAPLRKSHSASKTRVNALMALRCVRGTRLLRLLPQLRVRAAEIGRRGILADLDNAAADGTGAGKMLEQRLAVAAADRAGEF